jgi:hypothetical protein
MNVGACRFMAIQPLPKGVAFGPEFIYILDTVSKTTRF